MAKSKKATAPKPQKFPATLPLCIKRYAALVEKLEELGAMFQPINKEVEALRAHMLDNFKKSELDGMKAYGQSLALIKTVVPTIANFGEFLKYAMKKGNEDLLQKSVNTPAWRERMNDGKQVPGVKPFDRVALRITKVQS